MVIPADEPDKVSELIVKVINDGAFEFTPEYRETMMASIGLAGGKGCQKKVVRKLRKK